MVSFDDDEMKTLMSAAEVVSPEYRGAFLSALAQALATDPDDRAAIIAKVQRKFLAMSQPGCCTGDCSDRWGGD